MVRNQKLNYQTSYKLLSAPFWKTIYLMLQSIKLTKRKTFKSYNMVHQTNNTQHYKLKHGMSTQQNTFKILQVIIITS